ncbi:MAG: 23S rRNA (pseudouridine(1915)-N(3))-methyltransferase RlmH [Bdellovibrionia bacterium]
MKVVFLTVATAKEEWADQAIGLYLKKLNHFFPTEYRSLKPKKYSRDSSEIKKQEDSVLLLESISKDDFVFLLDEKGQTLDSLQFSKKIETVLMSGKKRIVFVVGGAFGVSEELKKRADLQLSLSKMVFNHLVAQVVVCEQVYRALTIKNNLPYHNL